MPQLDISSFIPQIFWVTVIFFFSYSLIFRITVPSFSKLNWGRALLVNRFKMILLSQSKAQLGSRTQKEDLLHFLQSKI